MASAGTLYVTVAAQTDPLTRGLKKSRAEVKSFANFTTSTLSKMGAGVAGVLAVDQLADAFFRTAESIDSVGSASERLGVSTEALVGLQHGAELSGVSAEALTAAMTKLSRLIGEASSGTKSAIASFNSLGVSFKNLEGIPLDQALGTIADKMNEIENPTDRVRIAMELFGKGGAPMLDLLKEGSAGMKAFQADAEKLGMTFSREEFQRVEKFNDELERLKKMLGGAFQGLVIDITPGALKAVESLQGILGKRDDSFQGLRFTPGGVADRIVSFIASGGDARFGQSAGIGQRRMDGDWGKMFHPQTQSGKPRLDFGFLRSHFGAMARPVTSAMSSPSVVNSARNFAALGSSGLNAARGAASSASSSITSAAMKQAFQPIDKTGREQLEQQKAMRKALETMSKNMEGHVIAVGF
jgi:hypothetical protein